MEREEWPQFNLFPRLSKIGHLLFDHIQYEGLSNHGGGPMLDELEVPLDTQMKLEYSTLEE